jgi:hypothetical protein
MEPQSVRGCETVDSLSFSDSIPGRVKMKKEQKNRVLSARLVLAALLTICAPTLSAQNVTGTILGAVTDPEAALYPM